MPLPIRLVAAILVSLTAFPIPSIALVATEASTEQLLLINSGGTDPGRMWPGFAAAPVRPDSAPAAPRNSTPVSESLAPLAAGVSALTGGDLSSTVDLLTGTASLTGSPSSASSLGSQAGQMLGALSPSASTSGLSTTPTASNATSGTSSMSGLSSLLGTVGTAALLSFLPQMLSENSGQAGVAISGATALLYALAPTLSSLGISIPPELQAALGLASGTLQQVGNLDGSPVSISGLQGAVAGATNASTGTGSSRTWRGYVPTDVNALRGILPEGGKALAETFVAAGQKYDIDPLFLASISRLETGNWAHSSFTKLNNAMGISNISGPTAQSSAVSSIMNQAAELAGAPGTAGYYRSANTVAEAGAIYAPVNAPNDRTGNNKYWGSEVGQIYDQYVSTLRRN